MKFCRFGDGRLGLVEGNIVRDVTAALDVLPRYGYPLPQHDIFIANLEVVVTRARAVAKDAPALPLDGLTLLSPVANPGKIIAAPVNYQKHLNEVRDNPQLHGNNPGNTFTIQTAGLFLKATSSLVGPGQGIVVRCTKRRTDHEVELAVVIGRTASRVKRDEALSYVAGYSIGLDISIRGSEDRSFRKSPDSYSVLGPWLVTADEIPDPGVLDLQLTVNEELRQHSNTKYMILGVPELIELASAFYTLQPGDLLFTGTPEGVSPIQAGDRIVATIDTIGTMTVATRADASRESAMSGATAGA
ncbi:MAG TPA: fumarylacetoacetate hydrolase family protein [Vicinamibacterales bacterium]|jgi:2-keto-4-pentenoate hydratase/2-oxohepta-3-ene-1,7-dioic acid hydratase in catechol pathway|nr:fumarylacetoacetate hydrolase family protein [Vicinamibacterales bacterium]